MLFTKRNENWAWSQVTREQHILGNSSRRTSSFSEFFAPGVGILNKVLYGDAPPRGPTPYYPFTHYFWRKRYPFHISSICIIASVELSILFNCCDECTVFEIWIGSLNDLITWSTYGKHENWVHFLACEQALHLGISWKADAREAHERRRESRGWGREFLGP